MDIIRKRYQICGAVQGVGFRPFVYRLAQELGLRGWVLNNAQGVTVEAEATARVLDEFTSRLNQERPEQALIQSIEEWDLDFRGYQALSEGGGGRYPGVFRQQPFPAET